jgi:hypothetical protein
MKEQIENYIRSYTLGDITLAQCVEAIYNIHKKEAPNFSMILLIIIVAISMIL